VISSYSGNLINSAELSSVSAGSGPSSKASVERDRGLTGLLLNCKERLSYTCSRQSLSKLDPSLEISGIVRGPRTVPRMTATCSPPYYQGSAPY